MRKNVFGRQLRRDANERKSLFKGLMLSLVQHEQITTTEAKARAIKGTVEKLVTKAKQNSLHAKKMILGYLTPAMTKKLMEEVAPRFADRQGGYTRLIKLGSRFSDNAKMAVIEFVSKKPEIVRSEIVKVSKENSKNLTEDTSEKVEEAVIVKRKTAPKTKVKS